LNRSERAFLLLSGIFLGALVLTNLIAGKFFLLFGRWPVSVGIIPYPVTFLVTDLISEIYGRAKAALVVRTGFWVSLFAVIVVLLSDQAPVAVDATYVDQETFHRVFGLAPGLVLASMVAYLSAQFIDVQLFHFWRRLTNGRHLWLRNNASTLVSQFVDSVMVVSMALIVWPLLDGLEDTEPVSLGTAWTVILGSYLFKAAVAFLDTPAFYLGTWALERWIGRDPDPAPGRREPGP